MADSNLDNADRTYVKWGGLINEFLWSFSGANKPLLRQCPNEYSKYAGMGGTILGTAIMAAFSGGYAIYFVFEDLLIAAIFGLFWGMLILNLDRFIVSTMYSDGKHTISWMELWSGLPRILMAIFLGIVISTPLEMKLFEERIDIQISEIQQERIKENMSNTAQNDILKELIIKRDSINSKLESRYKDIQSQRKALDEEEMGFSRSGKAGRGPAYSTKKINLEKSEKEYAEYKSSIQRDLESLDSQIDQLEEKLKDNRSEYESIVKENGFCQRYEAFAKIDNNNPELAIVIWFIRLLFIIIEVSPVFFRMMIATGSYDELLHAKALFISKMAEKESREIIEEYNAEIAINTERNRIRLEAENKANKELYYGIADAQSKVIATAINNWKQQELEKVAKDPSSYIKIN